MVRVLRTILGKQVKLATGFARAENDGTIETHLRPTRLTMPAHPAAIVMMIHHPGADFRFALGDRGANFDNDAARLMPADDRARNTADA